MHLILVWRLLHTTSIASASVSVHSKCLHTNFRLHMQFSKILQTVALLCMPKKPMAMAPLNQLKSATELLFGTSIIWYVSEPGALCC